MNISMTLRVLPPQGGIAYPIHQFRFYVHPQLISVSPGIGDSTGRSTMVKICGNGFFGGGSSVHATRALCLMNGEISDAHILSDSEI